MLANPAFTLDLAKYHDSRSRAQPTYNDYELDRQMFSIMPKFRQEPTSGSSSTAIGHKVTA